LSGADSGGVTGRAASNDNEIVGFGVRHVYSAVKA
jgi:hypothetical protein